MVKIAAIAAIALLVSFTNSAAEKSQNIYVSAKNLHEVCSAGSGKDEFLLCLVFLRGWVEGAQQQSLETTIKCIAVKIKKKSTSVECVEAKVWHCLDTSKTTDIEISRSYVDWYDQKINRIPPAEVTDFESRSGGYAIRQMLRNVYKCPGKLGD
jgi:hypothetical protein